MLDLQFIKNFHAREFKINLQVTIELYHILSPKNVYMELPSYPLSMAERNSIIES